jgi:hypothetical protein
VDGAITELICRTGSIIVEYILCRLDMHRYNMDDLWTYVGFCVNNLYYIAYT